jgi:hypothetical protein
MRTYGRTYDEFGVPHWQVVETDVNGNSQYVYVTTLVQCLKLILGESPFYANYGLPAIQSVLTRIFPDYYVYQTQSQFAQFFASLIINKVPSLIPTYNVNLVLKDGTMLNFDVTGIPG